MRRNNLRCLGRGTFDRRGSFVHQSVGRGFEAHPGHLDVHWSEVDQRGGDIIVPVEVQTISVIMAAVAGSSAVWALVHFKLRKKELEMRGSDPELGPVVDALRNDVEQLADMQEHTQAQLADMQERLDFAERLLTAGRASQDEEGK